MTLAMFAAAEVQHELVHRPLGGGSALRTPFGPGIDIGEDGVGESYPASVPSVYQPRLSPRPGGHPATLISAPVSKESLPDQGSGAQSLKE